MTPWLTVIGIGEDGFSALHPDERMLVRDASLIVGGQRHLDMLPESVRGERLAWRRPLMDTMEDIAARRGTPVVALATGNPMSFGIGATLVRHFSPAETRVVPAVGAYDLVCARLGWHREETSRVTLHGRPLAALRLHVSPERQVLIMSEDGSTPVKVAALLCELGYGDSPFHVLERLGGPKERIESTTARSWSGRVVDDLNTIAVDCVAGPEAVVWPLVPGLPDEAFVHDGQLTKRVVRAATVAALAPMPDACLWDLGAGCGSVAIEWLRAAPNGTAYAVERNAERCAMVKENAGRLGVPHLDVRRADVGEAVVDLPTPDAVFIGGGISESDIVETSWAALRSGGRLVANVVTVEGEAAVLSAYDRYGGALTRIGVSHAEPVGGRTGWRTAMPVTQWIATKR